MGELADSLKIDLSVLSGNIQDFFRQIVKPTYLRLVRDADPLRKMLLCKEDKEQLIKSKIRALTQLFLMVNGLCDQELKTLGEIFAERDEEAMDTQGVLRVGELRDELFAMALQIMLVPAAHSLQLLVQD